VGSFGLKALRRLKLGDWIPNAGPSGGLFDDGIHSGGGSMGICLPSAVKVSFIMGT